MLTVTGEAQFVNEGRLLATRVVIQPHSPAEHDMLERAAGLHIGAKMVEGQLVLERTLIVPEASAPLSESAATSANDSAPGQAGDSSASGAPVSTGAPASAERESRKRARTR